MFPENRFLELLIIGALALIVVGPKDLPVLMRRVGQFVGKMRGMAAEFRASFDELARQSELDELRREVEALRTGATLTGDPADPHAAGVMDEIKSNMAISMTPAMTPLPQPEPIASPAEAAPGPAIAEAKPTPARKPRAAPAKAADSDAAKPAPRKSRTTGPAA